MKIARLLVPFVTAAACYSAVVPIDTSGVRPGPIQVSSTPDSVSVSWSDEASNPWQAGFSLDPAKPLITVVAQGGKPIIERAQPIYRCSTGKRRGGWDAFFDFPPSHPDGTRSFQGEFKLQSAKASTSGDRVTLTFDGFHMGIFEGAISYTFYPGSRLVQQQAVVKTQEQDVAFYYDTGLRITADNDRRPGGNMESQIAYYDTQGQLRTAQSAGSDREPLAVRYRTIAARTENGSIAVFPAPHQYFFARDYTTNMANLWHAEWRGSVSIGVRQLPDDNSPYYPWMNAPPGTEQHLGVFYLLSTGKPEAVLNDVLRYTHKDRFPALAGYKTFAPHWHLAYTVQAMAKGNDWVPPFKPVMKAMGIDSAMIMDFHGDGHPADLTNLRLDELDAYFRATRAQSDLEFLLIPAEEANVHLGGHWAIAFPKPVYWHMDRKDATPFQISDAKYGKVYNIANEKELLDMVRSENGFLYQTHPRTKGSTGYPDKIRGTGHFRDPRYFGAGWKAMPSDLSSPRLGERSLKLLDDMNNWGMPKRILGEVDVFQIDSTHELYAHMNVNYVRMPSLPSYGNYGQILDVVAKGDFFVSTGEVLLPEVNIGTTDPNTIVVKAKMQNTFPLQMAEIVWGDGAETHRQIFPLETTRAFSTGTLEHRTTAKGWKWARFAVWDIAGNGAFVNPVSAAAHTRVIAVDGFHNNEAQPHYRWEGTYPGGFSELGTLLRGQGGELRTILTSMTPATLSGVDCLIIVDPDIPKENPKPNYIADDEITAIREWVRNGGRLVILGNDAGNAEFEHLNKLNAEFGFTFIETTHHNAQQSGKLSLHLPEHPIFDGAQTFYAVDVAPLKIDKPSVQAILSDNGEPIMALTSFGKGKVFALGDPWIYNEYIHSGSNQKIAENLFRYLLR